ncbi:NAD(P)/FAD-dependent oxidoreductase [Mycobacterium sp. 94-17]|uniref:flavin-containing monooxygenase n=1 Tax=Mycobacterium sp. 94-17 TaxID=2986147 RepID=UPI002D1E83F5|nr:NAD(P)/FAD-dependent oxidoreductase [Mycobacterium sp. 94-17]MEB4209779.1 NAD(P)/FAD-dependent oxidoreductase [Mycobacterium sp. 94-17]
MLGGGFGGLLAGARLREEGFRGIRIVELGGDFGGVWYWNRYPGCQCDVESYIYLPLLEETGYVPSERYVSATEIQSYCERIAYAYDLYSDALLSTRLTGLQWDDSVGRWHVSTDRADHFTAQYVVMANGPINVPKLPRIAGIELFAGHSFHTGRWDFGYTGGDNAGALAGLRDKRVAIIGTGASAVQAIPHLGEWAGHLYVFQRTPTMAGPRHNFPTDSRWFLTQPAGWHERRRDNFTAWSIGADPGDDLVDDRLTAIFKRVLTPEVVRVSRALGRRLTPAETSELLELQSFSLGEELRREIDSVVEDPATAAALKPWYRMLCKRPCPFDGYLETFNRPNVTLVDTDGRGVDRITRQGAVFNDTEYPVDCLIFASGFEIGTSITSRIGCDAVGTDGLLLSERWADGPHTMHGFLTRGFPNLLFMGTTQTAHHANVTHMLDEQARHITHLLSEVRHRGAHVLEATDAGEAAWRAEMQRSASSTRFDAECTPGYYNSEGDLDNPWGIVANRYGAGPVRFWEMLKSWRAEGTLEGIELR